ncbi:MAG: hypothetical protein ACXW06_08250 [Halobacteriota archaeon]
MLSDWNDQVILVQPDGDVDDAAADGHSDDAAPLVDLLVVRVLCRLREREADGLGICLKSGSVPFVRLEVSGHS